MSIGKFQGPGHYGHLSIAHGREIQCHLSSGIWLIMLITCDTTISFLKINPNYLFKVYKDTGKKLFIKSLFLAIDG